MAGKDGTDGKQGDPQAKPGQTPTPAPGTSDGTEKTYTESELLKAVSDGKADLGRKVATLTKTVDTLQADRDAAQKQLDEKELDGIRNDPAAVRALQSRKALETRGRDLDVRETAMAEREAAVQAKEVETTKAAVASAITRLATEHGIEPSKLTDLGIEDVETLEKVAASISGKAPAKTPPLTRVDSGKSKGGTSLEGMTPSQKIMAGIEQQRRKGG